MGNVGFMATLEATMQRSHRLWTSAALLLVSGCGVPSSATPWNVVNGSGTIITEQRDVTGFTGVCLRGSGALVIEQTGEESLAIVADDNLMPLLTSDVRDGKLILSVNDNTSIRPTEQITYRLTVKDLSEIEISGSGAADAKGIQTDRLASVISGSGKIIIAGKANEQVIVISGSGDFLGEGLKCKKAAITVSGSGKAVLAVSDTLDATISGSGSTKYVGEPKVNTKVSGSGSVQKKQ